MIGDWHGNSDPDHSKLTIHFDTDSVVENFDEFAGRPFHMEMDAKYTLEGNRLTTNASYIHVSSPDPKDQDDVAKANQNFTPEALSKMEGDKWTLDWKDNDTVTMTSTQGGETAIYHLTRGIPPTSNQATSLSPTITPEIDTPNTPTTLIDSEHQTIESHLRTARNFHLTDENVRSWTPKERYLIRNGIYAMHGAEWKKAPALTTFFSRYPWYVPNINQNDIHLPKAEDENAKLILSVEKALAQQGIPIYKP